MSWSGISLSLSLLKNFLEFFDVNISALHNNFNYFPSKNKLKISMSVRTACGSYFGPGKWVMMLQALALTLTSNLLFCNFLLPSFQQRKTLSNSSWLFSETTSKASYSEWSPLESTSSSSKLLASLYSSISGRTFFCCSWHFQSKLL